MKFNEEEIIINNCKEALKKHKGAIVMFSLVLFMLSGCFYYIDKNIYTIQFVTKYNLPLSIITNSSVNGKYHHTLRDGLSVIWRTLGDSAHNALIAHINNSTLNNSYCWHNLPIYDDDAAVFKRLFMFYDSFSNNSDSSGYEEANIDIHSFYELVKSKSGYWFKDGKLELLGYVNMDDYKNSEPLYYSVYLFYFPDVKELYYFYYRL